VGGSFDFTTFESVYIKLFVRILSKMYCGGMVNVQYQTMVLW